MSRSFLVLEASSHEAWWEDEPRRATRVIPTLLLKGHGFVKTTKFKKPIYLGDPINIVKIFNEKEADEIIILDIAATVENRGPNFDLLGDIAGECFMPLSYGGGIRTTDDIHQVTSLGFEKVCINTNAVRSPDLVRAAAERFGSSTIAVSIDVREGMFGKLSTYIQSARESTGMHPVEAAQRAEEEGAGELLVNSVNRDGTMRGYDISLIRQVADAVSIPVVACGGASNCQDLAEAALAGGASAVAAGSMFVFHGRHRAVLINTPTDRELAQAGLR